MTAALAFIIFTYLIASVPFGLVITTLYGGDTDIRQVGSGNIGATNVARVYGWNLAGPVMALDVGKGFIPVLLAQLMWPEWGLYWGGVIAATAWTGHCFSIYLDFKGGKGVATGAGGLLGLAPTPTLAAAAVWAGLLAGTGRSSVSALGAVIAMVGLAWVLKPEVLIIAALMAVATIGTHYTNIGRLVRGEENTVVRPVRWNRASTEKASPEQLLMEGPGGAHGPNVAMWKETLDDPLGAGTPGPATEREDS